MKEILVTGATGLVGSRFVQLHRDEFRLTPLIPPNEAGETPNAVSCDLLDFDALERVISETKPDVVLHLAAFTDVDSAQKEQGDETSLSWALNVRVTQELSKLTKKHNRTLIYTSTEVIFDGKKGPYSEDDEPVKSPDDISWYGWTKLMGEKKIQESGSRFLIARICYPYRARHESKTDFVRKIIGGLEDNNLRPMFSDQFLTPTFVDNIARALSLLIQEDQTGFWHVVDSTTLSPYEAAREVADVFGFDKNSVEEGSLEEFTRSHPQAAPRPKKGGMKNKKVNDFLAKHGTSMQTFREALVTMKGQMEA